MTIGEKRRAATSKAGRAVARTWLDQVDALVDWTRFDRYLRWLDASPEACPAHPPLVLFKAMLLLHWFALIAMEFDTEMEDRRSFRRFVGLADDRPPPDHAEVCDFRRLLLKRDIAVEIFSELRDQLDRFDPLTLAPTGGVGKLSALAAELQALGPPEWHSLEQSFLDFWYRKRRDRPAPLMRDITLGEAPELDPYLALIRVLPDGKFHYAHVGLDIEAANEGSLVGTTVDQKAAQNLRLRGHVGLQGELAAMFHHAVVEMRPVSTSTYFVNAGGGKCQIWSVSAPLNDDRGRVTMLIGVALIRPIAVN